MKNINYKLGLILLSFAAFISCESPEAEANYTPAEYEFPTAITLSSSNITNSSFDFTYTNSGLGEGYYVVVEGGSPAPSANDVFAGVADGLVVSGNFELTGSEMSISIGNAGLCDNESYDIYAVQFSSDDFLSPETVITSITTNVNSSIEGVYNTLTTGDLSGNFGGSVADFPGVVTVTDNGDGTFSFDDISAGIYPDSNYYGMYGGGPVLGTFEVPCNEISGAFVTDFYGCCGDYIAFDGMINSDGSLTVHWESAFGEVMDAVYTMQ